MYVILVYDVNEKRVGKVHKFMKRYLTWVQRSVFEGELTESELREIKYFFQQYCKDKEDGFLIYFIRDGKWLHRELWGEGVNKEDMDNFL